ncbi:MAG: DUF4369 domain-containing protein [Robiginitalea sp.]
MKKQLYFLGLLLLGAACNGEDPALQMIVEGNVQGLKKGTLYLQTIRDTALVSLDSIEIRGDGNFSLQAAVPEPDVYYLYLESADNNTLDDRISFFGEAGRYRIDTRWNNFEGDASIDGAEIHEKFEVYRENMSRFNLQQLELSQELAAMELPADSTLQDSLQNAFNNSLKRSYLYALNYALSNKESHLAPYIAWAEVSDANPKYLDSVYQSLPPNIAESKYGKKLRELLAEKP